ncbi:MAG: hypothetical protein ACREV2_17465, partial [Burkholderiales bacterium]
MLAALSGISPQQAAADLREAIAEGLVLPTEPAYESDGRAPAGTITYALLHDRVQQAAYELIAPEERQLVHLRIGRRLRERMRREGTDESLFDVVQHLNLGRGLITDHVERVELARLNLEAAGKAKSSTAYQAAREYLTAGKDLVSGTQSEVDPDLALALHLEGAESEYLCRNFDEVDRQIEPLLAQARTNLDKARVYKLQSVQYENLSRFAEALAVARKSLALFGVWLPESKEEKHAALESEIEKIQHLLGERSIESLVDLPPMTDPEVRMVMNILTGIWSSTYILGDVVLARLLSATMVRLSLIHGNLAESAYGYVTHAITVGPVRGDYQTAYEFGLLALRVNERLNDSTQRAKIHQQFHAHVNLWRKPMQS